MPNSYILLPTHGAGQLTPELIGEIRRAGVPYRFLLLEDSNVPRCGVPFARNRLMREALRDKECRYLVHLSSDISNLSPEWLRKTVDMFGDPKVGCVSLNKLVDYGSGFGNFRGGQFEKSTSPVWDFVAADHVQAVTSLCVLTREFVEKVGFFDEDFGLGGYEEIDLALRGWINEFRTVLAGRIQYHHIDSNKIPYPNLQEPTFAKKWGSSDIDTLTRLAKEGKLRDMRGKW